MDHHIDAARSIDQELHLVEARPYKEGRKEGGYKQQQKQQVKLLKESYYSKAIAFVL